MTSLHTLQALRQSLRSVITGQTRAIDDLLVGLLSGGHVLLEGAPGLAKTLMARTLAQASGLPFQRVQFTPDLMPADILGTQIYEQHTGTFRLHRGPVFTQVLLADEINRASPKTQSALLEAMAERQVSIDGQTLPLDAPYMVIATQNPLEHAGTYPLPEAQLDRFLLKVSLSYPSPEDEQAIYHRFLKGELTLTAMPAPIEAVVDRTALLDLQRHVRTVHVEDALVGYITRVVTASRTHPSVHAGLSPRAGMAWIVAAQAFAALEDSPFVTPDHLRRVARPVLAHRIVLHPHAEMEGKTPAQIIDHLLAHVAQP